MVLGKRVARNVRAIRIAKGLSQQKLADKTGPTVRYISRLENTAPNLTLEVIERLLKGLSCSAIDLIGDGNDEPKALPKAKESLIEAISILQGLRALL